MRFFGWNWLYQANRTGIQINSLKFFPCSVSNLQWYSNLMKILIHAVVFHMYYGHLKLHPTLAKAYFLYLANMHSQWISFWRLTSFFIFCETTQFHLAYLGQVYSLIIRMGQRQSILFCIFGKDTKISMSRMQFVYSGCNNTGKKFLICSSLTKKLFSQIQREHEVSYRFKYLSKCKFKFGNIFRL